MYMLLNEFIPVVTLNHKPTSTIVENHNIGIVNYDLSNLNAEISEIFNNYDLYRENCKEYMEEITWEKTVKDHAELFYS